jgi:hypothetical protein
MLKPVPATLWRIGRVDRRSGGVGNGSSDLFAALQELPPSDEVRGAYAEGLTTRAQLPN